MADHALRHGERDAREDPRHQPVLGDVAAAHAVLHVRRVAIVDELLDLTRQLDRTDFLRLRADVEAPVGMRRQSNARDRAALRYLLGNGLVDDGVRHEQLALADLEQRFLGPGLLQHLDGRAVVLDGCLDLRPVDILDLLHPVGWDINHGKHLLSCRYSDC